MKCNNFEVYMYDHDSDPNHKEQLLTDNEVQLQDLLVKFEPSTIPIVECTINTKNPSRFCYIKNLYITILTDNAIINYLVGVINFTYKNASIVFDGFLCTFDDINKVNSSYLGNTFINCVQSLNVKSDIKINGQSGFDEKFNDDFTLDYWKIQESNIQALHKILQLAYPTSIYTLDNDNIYINNINYNKTNYNYEAIPPDKIDYISKSSKINDLLQEDSKINNSLKYFNDTASDIYFGTSMGRSYITNIANMVSSYNIITSVPLVKYLGDFLIKGIYNKVYPSFILGNSMKAATCEFSTNSNWYIISKFERFSAEHGMEIAVLFSCN